MTSTAYKNSMESTARHFAECPNSIPIDLSLHRDSLGTRSTASPSDSSVLGCSLPSIPNDSPSTVPPNINNISSGSKGIAGSAARSSPRVCSNEPIHQHQSSAYIQQARRSEAAFHPYQAKRGESPSLPNGNTMHPNIRIHNYSAVAVGDLSPYSGHTVASHEHEMVQSQVQGCLVSNDSLTAAWNSPAVTPSSLAAVPTAMGRDNNADLELRKKKNIAARKYRDIRRKQTEETAIRIFHLERENHELRYELNELRQLLQFTSQKMA